MAKATVAPGIDVPAVEDHLSRYAVSCPLCKAVGQLGVAQDECRIISDTNARDGIAVVVVMCKRCGYLMPLASDRILAA
jgi:C4-type Zn-finger protein